MAPDGVDADGHFFEVRKPLPNGCSRLRWHEKEDEAAGAGAEQLPAQRTRLAAGVIDGVDRGVAHLGGESGFFPPRIVQQCRELRQAIRGDQRLVSLVHELSSILATCLAA